MALQPWHVHRQAIQYGEAIQETCPRSPYTRNPLSIQWLRPDLLSSIQIEDRLEAPSASSTLAASSFESLNLFPMRDLLQPERQLDETREKGPLHFIIVLDTVPSDEASGLTTTIIAYPWISRISRPGKPVIPWQFLMHWLCFKLVINGLGKSVALWQFLIHWLYFKLVISELGKSVTLWQFIMHWFYISLVISVLGVTATPWHNLISRFRYRLRFRHRPRFCYRLASRYRPRFRAEPIVTCVTVWQRLVHVAVDELWCGKPIGEVLPDVSVVRLNWLRQLHRLSSPPAYWLSDLDRPALLDFG